MSKDSVWEALKRDETKVYGEPIMDMFLKMTDTLEARHARELPPSRRDMIQPEIRLRSAGSKEEVRAAVKAGAKEFGFAARAVASRGDFDAMETLLDIGENEWEKSDALYSAMIGACGSGPIEIVRYLIKRARGVGLQFREEPIRHAALSGRRDVFELMYREYYEKRTPTERMVPEEMLFMAVRAGSIYVVKKEMGGVPDDDLKEIAEFARRKGRNEIADMIHRELGLLDGPDDFGPSRR